MGKKYRALIIGATGYGGVGLVELLLRHPSIEVAGLVAKDDADKPLSETFAHLSGFCDLKVFAPDAAFDRKADVVFFATPDGVGMRIAAEYVNAGTKAVDFSGDFRFSDPEEHARYAARIKKEGPHAAPALLKESVYGLPELHRDAIKKARLVGNPGCFAVSMILGLLPAVEEGIVSPRGIVCDGKTGVSGAGRFPGNAHTYCARYENANAYKVLVHQHPFEVERELSRAGKKEIVLSFVPQVIPLARGIMTTIYADLAKKTSAKDVEALYRRRYAKEPFVRVTPAASTATVRGSNFCDVSVHVDERNGKLVVVSCIDNLVKGQAGNAIQNANLLLGLDEREGLFFPGSIP